MATRGVIDSSKTGRRGNSLLLPSRSLLKPQTGLSLTISRAAPAPPPPQPSDRTIHDYFQGRTRPVSARRARQTLSARVGRVGVVATESKSAKAKVKVFRFSSGWMPQYAG